MIKNLSVLTCHSELNVSVAKVRTVEVNFTYWTRITTGHRPIDMTRQPSRLVESPSFCTTFAVDMCVIQHICTNFDGGCKVWDHARIRFFYLMYSAHFS